MAEDESSKSDASEDRIAKTDAPQLTINLRDIFGVASVELQIPLPKIKSLRLPFSARFRAGWQGWFDGRSGVPDLYGSEYSSFEGDIQDRAEHALVKLEEAADDYRAAVDRVLNDATPHPLDADTSLKQIRNKCLQWIEQHNDIIREIADKLPRSKQRLDDAEEELDRFVRSAGLNAREPRGATVGRAQWADRVIAGTTDVLISAILIKTNPDYSWLDAVVLALLFAGLNIFFAVAWGSLAVRRLLYARKAGHGSLEIYVAWTIFAFFLFAGVVTNVVFALKRDQGRTADLIHLGTAVMPISLMGCIVLLFGLSIFGLVGFKAYRSSVEDYPGHLERWRTYVGALAVWRYNDEYRMGISAAIRAQGRTVLDSVRDEIGAYIRAMHRTETDAKSCLTLLTTIQEKLRRHAQQFLKAAQTLSRRYRECYFRRRRKDGVLRQETYPPLKLAQPNIAIDQQIEKAKDIKQQVELNRNELQKCHDGFEKDVVPEIRRLIEEAAEKMAKLSPQRPVLRVASSRG